jgi:excisionase family DNA binding protein
MEKLILSQFSKEELQEILLKPILGRIEKIETGYEKTNIDPVLTREQTAKRFNVDLSTLHRWTKQGKIVAHAIGSRIYYKESSIQEALVKLEAQKSHKL